MLNQRKHRFLSGLVVLFGLSIAGAAWSQDPATQQAPAPSSAPGYVDPMLRPPPRVPAPDAAQAPAATPSPAPTSTPPPPRQLPAGASKKKEEPAKQKSAPLPKPQALPPVADAPAPAPPSSPAVAENPGSMASPAQTLDGTATAQAAPQSATKPVPVKKGKQPYTGPKDIVELQPSPMLDEEGRQRLDPSGVPMFNPPVKQQRDKQGHPLFDGKGQPVFQTATDLGYDDKGKKIKPKKEKVPKTQPVNVAKGTLTVDGLIGKAELNYEIKEFKYIYLYAPWIGTVVVSNRTFPGAKEQQKAFDQHTLTVTVEDHQFQLFSEKLLMGKKPESAFVAVDRDFKLDTRYPAVGYGKSLQPPYGWPGAKVNTESKAYVKPPPLPKNLRQTMLLPACPEGQLRPPTPPAKPGQQPSPLPCVVVEGAKASGTPAVIDPPAPTPEIPAAAAAPAPETAPAPTPPPSVPPL